MRIHKLHAFAPKWIPAKDSYVLASGVREYSHCIHTEGGGEGANTLFEKVATALRLHIWKTIPQKDFPVFARVRMQAPHILTQKLYSPRFFSCVYWFRVGGYFSRVVKLASRFYKSCGLQYYPDHTTFPLAFLAKSKKNHQWKQGLLSLRTPRIEILWARGSEGLCRNVSGIFVVSIFHRGFCWRIFSGHFFQQEWAKIRWRNPRKIRWPNIKNQRKIGVLPKTDPGKLKFLEKKGTTQPVLHGVPFTGVASLKGDKAQFAPNHQGKFRGIRAIKLGPLAS